MLYYLSRWLWIFWCWIELSIFTLLLYGIAWLPGSLTRPFYRKLFRIWCRFFIRALGVNLRLYQNNAKPLPSQYILIANHPSALEDVGIPALFDVVPLAKMGVKKWFLVGRINVAAQTLFVQRDSRESRHKASDDLAQLLEKGDNIALFPEGGCKGRRLYSTFQYGAFDISIKSNIPILPVFLHYEAQEVFEWQDHTLLQKMWHFMKSQNNRANYYVFDAIDPSTFSNKQDYTEHVYELYQTWQKKYLE